MFLDLPDPNPDPLIRDTYPDLNPKKNIKLLNFFYALFCKEEKYVFADLRMF